MGWKKKKKKKKRKKYRLYLSRTYSYAVLCLYTCTCIGGVKTCCYTRPALVGTWYAPILSQTVVVADVSLSKTKKQKKNLGKTRRKQQINPRTRFFFLMYVVHTAVFCLVQKKSNWKDIRPRPLAYYYGTATHTGVCHRWPRFTGTQQQQQQQQRQQ